MESWNLLDEKEESELHKVRLLNVEEKVFKRVTKRLVTLNTLASSKARQAPTPPPDAPAANGASQTEQDGTGAAQSPKDDAAAATAADGDDDEHQLDQLRQDMTLDFAAFDSSIQRLQFLLTANERERARYAADRVRILDTSQGVRGATARLRSDLERARATLAQRRQFDELADRITGNRLLRPRAEQAANIRKLEEECAQLEAESETYAATWRERRDQFSRIMDESMRLRRLIRDEKEEVERREGMDEDADVGSPRPGSASGNATPRPESGLAVAKGPGGAGGGLESGDGGATPRASTLGGRTPARDSPGPTDGHGLKIRPDASGSFSRNGSQAPSRDGTPARGEDSQADGPEEGEDVDMGDGGETVDSPLTPLPAGETPPRIVVDTEEDAPEDKMDTT